MRFTWATLKEFWPQTIHLELKKQLALNARNLRPDFGRMLKSGLTLMVLAALFLPGASVLAQGNIDTSKLEAGSKSIIDGIQAVCLIAIPVLFVAGFGTLMYSGFSDTFRRVAIRIIGFCFAGAIGLFLFAQPLADLVIGSVGNKTGG